VSEPAFRVLSGCCGRRIVNLRDADGDLFRGCWKCGRRFADAREDQRIRPMRGAAPSQDTP
jgi:hypothetical protein